MYKWVDCGFEIRLHNTQALHNEWVHLMCIIVPQIHLLSTGPCSCQLGHGSLRVVALGISVLSETVIPVHKML